MLADRLLVRPAATPVLEVDGTDSGASRFIDHAYALRFYIPFFGSAPPKSLFMRSRGADLRQAETVMSLFYMCVLALLLRRKWLADIE